jgi:hypothetical protein
MIGYSDALYYPCTEYPDEQWLSTAALYWDRIHTIVTQRKGVPYDTPVARRLYEMGVLVPLRVMPDMPELTAIGEEALAFLDTPAGKMIAEHGGPPRIVRKGKRPRIMRKALSGKTIEANIRNASPDATEKLIRVSPVLADYYNTLVAQRFAEWRGLAMVSDEGGEFPQLAQRAFLESTLGRQPLGPIDEREGQGIVANLVLHGIQLPQTVAIDDVLNFRDNHREELGRLRSKVADLARSVAGHVTTTAVVQRAKDACATEIVPALDVLRKQLTKAKIEVVPGAVLSVACFGVGSGSLLTSVVGDPVSSIAIGAVATLALGIVKYRLAKQQILLTNPYTYVLQIDRFS